VGGDVADISKAAQIHFPLAGCPPSVMEPPVWELPMASVYRAEIKAQSFCANSYSLKRQHWG
jgi:hypothetical protein